MKKRLGLASVLMLTACTVNFGWAEDTSSSSHILKTVRYNPQTAELSIEATDGLTITPEQMQHNRKSITFYLPNSVLQPTPKEVPIAGDPLVKSISLHQQGLAEKPAVLVKISLYTSAPTVPIEIKAGEPGVRLTFTRTGNETVANIEPPAKPATTTVTNQPTATAQPAAQPVAATQPVTTPTDDEPAMLAEQQPEKQQALTNEAASSLSSLSENTTATDTPALTETPTQTASTLTTPEPLADKPLDTIPAAPGAADKKMFYFNPPSESADTPLETTPSRPTIFTVQGPVSPEEYSVIKDVSFDNKNLTVTSKTLPITVKNSFILRDPNRYVVDISPAVLETTSVSKALPQSDPHIKSVKADQLDPKTVRVTVQFNGEPDIGKLSQEGDQKTVKVNFQ